MKTPNCVKKILLIIFLICINLISYGEMKEVKFLIVSEDNSSESGTISYNIARALKDASLKSNQIDINKLPDYTYTDLEKYSAVILGSKKAAKFFYTEDAIKYLKSGGLILCATYCWSQELMNAIGVKANSLDGLEAKGFKSIVPVFKNAKLELAPKEVSYWCKDFSFSKEWKILMEYKEPSIPMLTERKFGKGKIVFWNTSALCEKFFRGFFIFSLLRNLPVAAMSVQNVTLIHLDDTPPPAYNVMEGPVATDLGFNDKQFYYNRWLKEVLPLLDENNLPFTFFVCFRYDGKITGPFFTKSDRDPFFRKFLNVLLKRHDDAGFHGYNHQSLTMGKSPSKTWKSFDEMKKSVAAGFKMWSKYNLPPTLVYVEPNNVIDINGKLVLAKEFPTIRVICGTFDDIDKHYIPNPKGYIIKNKNLSSKDLKNIKNLYSLYASRRSMVSRHLEKYMKGDEFGVDPEVPKFLDLPRMTSDELFTSDEKMLMLNGIMEYGMVIHFFHPDDMYDPSRRGKSWEQTYAALRRLVIFLNKNFGFSRRITTSAFLPDYKRYIFGNANIMSDNKETIKINSKGRKYFYLFSERPVSRPIITGGKLEAIIESNHLFLIKLDENKAIIKF